MSYALPRRVVALVVALAVAWSGSACAGGGGGTDAAASAALAEDGRRYVVDRMQAFVGGQDRLQPLYRTLDEALPNVTYQHADGSRYTGSDVAVVGTIAAVEKGRGFTVDGADAASGKPVAFDTKGAKWWSLHMVVDVERTIGQKGAPKRIKVYLSSPGPDEFGIMAAGLRSLGKVVLLLRERHGLAMQYDPSLYVVAEVGGMFATVAEDGALALPFLSRQRADAMLAGTKRLSDLELKGASPRVIPVVGPAGLPRRAD
jgi:hypothetical protein